MWKKLTKNIMEINGWSQGKIEIYYEAYPELITKNTSTQQKIDLEETFTRLIPLYIAGELYKDDDLTLSTMYMNEFMTLVNTYSNDRFNYNNSRIETIYSME